MTPQAPRATFYHSSFLLLCGLSGVLAFPNSPLPRLPLRGRWGLLYRGA